MTYFDLCKNISGLKKNESIEKFCNYAKWFCNYNKLAFNETNVKTAFNKYRKSPQF